MSINIQDVPILNQILQRPGLSHFSKAVNLDDLLDAMPQEDRPNKVYHKPKILQKLGIPRAYVSEGNDIFKNIPLSSLKRNKKIWVPLSDARRILKSRAEELIPLTEVDEVDGVQFPVTQTQGIVNHGIPTLDSDIPTLERVIVTGSEQFVDSDGNLIPISMCGTRTYSGLRLFVNDIYKACNYDRKHALGGNLSGVVTETVNVDGAYTCVVNFRNAIRIFSHFDRQGSDFAMSFMDWCAEVVFSVQYEDDEPKPEKMAKYMKSVAGRTCPNPMSECKSKMLYLEVMGDVASLQSEWPELSTLVPSGEDPKDYKAAKVGEGSGHRFGDNARAIKLVHPDVEPDCYDFRPTILDKKNRMIVEKAVANSFSKYALPINPDRRFAGDTEIFVVHNDLLSQIWKFMQSEISTLEEDVQKSMEDMRVLELEHQLEISKLVSSNKDLASTLSKMSIAIQTLPPSARKRFESVMRSCESENN